VANLALGRRGKVTREDGEARRVQEELGLLADLDDVGVLGDRPERLDVGAVVPEDRCVAAEPRPFRVWIAVPLVVLGARDVEGGAVEGGRSHGLVSP
jgi:hypothetical protein